VANPSPNTGGLRAPWEPGESGNPGGKSSEQKRREMRNAEMATRLQEAMLEREIALLGAPIDTRHPDLVAALKGVLSDKQIEVIVSHIDLALTNERLKLIKDAQDRGLGSPQQHVEVGERYVVKTEPLSPEEWLRRHASPHGDEGGAA
jgi:hypothetical protein